MKIGNFTLCILFTLMLTPVAMFIAIESGGGGHGNYFYAKLLFPYTMLLPGGLAIGIVQFPFYGLSAGFAFKYPRIWLKIVGVLVVSHLIAVVICFSGVLRNF
jgi:hypothetical protein